MATIAEQLSEFVHRLTYEELPEPVVHAAKLHILDTIGVCLSSASMDFAGIGIRIAAMFGGNPDATVFGSHLKLPVPNAVLANGILAHGIDFDDTHFGSVTHASSCVVPTAFAMGEMLGTGGKEVLLASVAGYEATTRIGLAAPSQFHRRGFHPTPVCGTFGAAVAAAKLLGMGVTQIADALGLCGSLAAGFRGYQEDGSWNKRIHAGWAGHSGTMAALFARDGFTGAHWVFDGKFSLYRTYLGDAPADPSAVVDGLGSRWETPNISFKPYPCGQIIHPYLDCLLALRREQSLRPEEVSSIECLVGELPASIVLEPRERKYRPPAPYTALFSLPYGLALALAYGEVSLQGYTEEKVKDPDLLRLAGLVEWTLDPASEYPAHFGGTLRVRTKDGRLLERSERDSLGSPDNPLSDEDVILKFRQNASTALPSTKAEALIEAILHLEEVGSIRSVAELCVA